MQEVRYDGIRVAYVLPGSCQHRIRRALEHEIGWALMPEDVAQAVVDLSHFHRAACRAAWKYARRSRRERA